MNEINLNCGVYQIRNIITNVCYGGQSIHLKQRPSQHWNSLKYNKHKNSHLQNSYNKRGREFFVFEILLYCAPEDLTKYEQLFCDIDKEHGLSYNIRDCVDSNKGLKYMPETIEKMSGENHWNYGKHPSPQTREKRSGKNNGMYGLRGKDSPNYGRKNTLESIEKMCKNHVGFCGKTHSPETIEKMKEVKKGENNPLWGKHHSKETREKMKNAHKYQIPWNKGEIDVYSENTIEKMRKVKLIKKEVVLEILGLLNNGLSVTEILKKVSVCKKTVYKVKNGFYNDVYDLKD